MNNDSNLINQINPNNKILKEFSSKFIATITASSDDYRSGGSKKGWLLSDAIKQFDKDWGYNYSYYMEKIGCEQPLELVQKLGSEVRIFLDGYNGWRVATMKNLKNSNVLSQIDSEIEKRNRIRRCPVFIPPNNKGDSCYSSNSQNFANLRGGGNNNILAQSSSSSFSRKVNFQKRVMFTVAPSENEEISVLCERMDRLVITKELLTLYNNIED